MTRDKLLLIGVVALGLLGFLVYKQEQKDAAMGTPMAATKDFPTISATDDIDKISITNGDKGEIVLERVPDPKGAPADGGPATVWELTKPIKAPANQSVLKDLLTNMKDLKVDSQVNIKLDDQVRKDKDLDAAHALHLVAYKGADKKVDESFGKSGAAGQLVVLTDKPDAVWAAKGYSGFLYTKEPKDFRDKEILHFDDANAVQVTINNTHGTFSFTKGGDKWAATFDKKPLARFADDKIKSMLSVYKAINADDFGDAKTLAETGLDKPDGTVTVTLKDGAGVYKVLVGKVAIGANHWAKLADRDLIIQVTNYVSDWALADESKFQGPADAGAPDSGKK